MRTRKNLTCKLRLDGATVYEVYKADGTKTLYFGTELNSGLKLSNRNKGFYRDVIDPNGDLVGWVRPTGTFEPV